MRNRAPVQTRTGEPDGVLDQPLDVDDAAEQQSALGRVFGFRSAVSGPGRRQTPLAPVRRLASTATWRRRHVSACAVSGPGLLVADAQVSGRVGR